MIAIEPLAGGLFAIRCSSGFVKKLQEEARITPGMRWDDEERSWVGYADAVHVTCKRAHARGLRIQGGFGPVDPTGLLVATKNLRPYQIQGIDFLIAKADEGCILADELGMGKSAQAATAARALRQKTVILCPNLGRGVWLDPDGELAKWWPKAKTIGLKGIKADPAKLQDHDVAVLHYEILHAWVDVLIGWGVKTLIIDEGQYLSGYSSRRTRSALKLAQACTHRMMLTGTPMENRIRDLWSPVNVISPGRFGKSFHKFGIRHCDGHQEQIELREEGVKFQRAVWKFDGHSEEAELKERLHYSPATPWGFLLRRLKSEVGLQLPPHTRQIISVDVDREFIAAPIHEIRSDTLLRQALTLAAEGKFEQVVDLVVGHLQSGQRVVVGTYRKRIAEMIASEVKRRVRTQVGVIHGEIPLEKRQEVIKSRPNLLCCTLDSTKAAINLSYWPVGVVAELVWVPATLRQWEGRRGRDPNSGKPLTQYVVARGTADDLIKRGVLNKLGTERSVLGNDDGKLEEDLRELGKAGAAERLQRLAASILAA